MKDSQGKDIGPGDVLENSHLRNTRKIYMMSSNGSIGMFRYMGKTQGAGDKFRFSQDKMSNSKWVKVGA